MLRKKFKTIANMALPAFKNFFRGRPEEGKTEISRPKNGRNSSVAIPNEVKKSERTHEIFTQ